MKITAIKQQVRLKDRYSVHIDGVYSFSLSEQALLDSRLASGQELDQQQVSAYKQLSADDKLYAKALRWVAMRLRSQWELRQYLQRKDAAPDLAEDITQRLTRLGFIDDAAYARTWVENRRQLKPTSIRKMQMELRAKRVSDEHIQAALRPESDNSTFGEPAPPVNDLESMRQLVVRKRRQIKYHDNDRLMQYLARQGFGYDDIKRVLAEDAEE